MKHPASQFGGILGKLPTLILLGLVVGGGWWWFFGRFGLPSSEPSKPTAVVSVLDYAGRRDLGTDPLDDMDRPDPKTGRDAPLDLKLTYARWFTEYTATVAARGAWRVLHHIGAGAMDKTPGWDGKVHEAHLTYLHHAQLAEYHRARWLAESDCGVW
jgi:hypothetical protein